MRRDLANLADAHTVSEYLAALVDARDEESEWAGVLRQSYAEAIPADPRVVAIALLRPRFTSGKQ